MGGSNRMNERKIRIAQIFWVIFLIIFSITGFSLLGNCTLKLITEDKKISLGISIFLFCLIGVCYLDIAAILLITTNKVIYKVVSYINDYDSEDLECVLFDLVFMFPIMLNELAKKKQARKAIEEAIKQKQKEEEMDEVNKILREEDLIL